MGLDMMLYAVHNINAQYDWYGITGYVNIYRNHIKIPIEFKNITQIECEVVYWRKAYQIDNWFKQNVSKNDKRGSKYYISKEKLRELVDKCEHILQNKDTIKEVLGMIEGILVKDSNLNLKDMEYTISRLKELDLSDDNSHVEYYYMGSF